MNNYSEFGYNGYKSYKGLGDIKNFIRKALVRLLGDPSENPSKIYDTTLALTALQVSLKEMFAHLVEINMRSYKRIFEDNEPLTPKRVEKFVETINKDLDTIMKIIRDKDGTRLEERFPELRNAIYAEGVMLVSDLKSILDVISESVDVPNTNKDPNGMVEALDIIREFREQMYDLDSKDIPAQEKREIRKRRKKIIAFLSKNIEDRKNEIIVHLDDAEKNSQSLGKFILATVKVVEVERVSLAKIKKDKESR